MLWRKQLLGYILQLGCRDGINLSYQLVEAAFLAIVQKVFGHVEGKLLAIVCGNSKLSLQLSFSSSQLPVA